MNPEKIDKNAKRIWDYHHMNHKLEKADVIIVLGSNDIRVAEYGAKLFLGGWAPIIVFSGGQGKLTLNWNKPEAEIFSEKSIEMGVPKEKILIENRSGNTGENFEFTRALLKKKNIYIKKALIVQKPYMERRAYVTCKKVWPEVDIIVTSPRISLEDYPNERISKDYAISIMVGDLQRIKIYPKLGFQIHQEIPESVWQAYEKLVKAGYTKHLIKE